ncbi:MAG TPA: ABC transporter ATP-binding protein [Mucilaginibacter sp.]
MEPLITLKDIGRKYVIGTEIIHALKSVSLTINKGEFVALMGPSGSGKSTLMNILGCLDTPSKGEYILNGINVSHMTDNELAEVRNTEIGFVFQTFNLLPRNTALDNVALPLVYAGINKENRQARARKSLENVGLANRMDHKPNELSGGQRQRVAVARALINNPSIILADEPTGNLDTKTSIEIMGLMEDIHSRGNTIILVTHEEDIALHAHRIVRMRDGLVENDYLNTNIQRVDRTVIPVKETTEPAAAKSEKIDLKK